MFYDGRIFILTQLSILRLFFPGFETLKYHFSLKDELMILMHLLEFICTCI